MKTLACYLCVASRVTFHEKRQKQSPNGRGPRPRACGQRKNKKEEFL